MKECEEVEEMARELYQSKIQEIPLDIPTWRIRARQLFAKDQINSLTPAEIRAKYTEMKGEKK